MLAARLAAAEDIADPWPHSILDDFLPESVFAELRASLPAWTGPNKTRLLPQSILDLLKGAQVEDAIRTRWGFSGGKATIDLTYRTKGIKPHNDRNDKKWSGILYLAGAAVGTQLFDAGGKATEVAFRSNRLLAWGHQGERHAVPDSAGRWAIQWWILE